MHEERQFITDFRNIVATLLIEGSPVRSRWIPPDRSIIEKSKDNEQNGFIDAAHTALELGHPTVSSIFLSIVTQEDNLVEDNRVTVIGNELSELAPGRYSLALILLAKAAETDDATRRGLNRYILDCNKLGGVMVRMSSGKIWMRLSPEALSNRLSLEDVGRYILGRVKGSDRYLAAEVLFVISDQNHVERLISLAEKQRQARNERFQTALVEKMACETGLDCDQCPETETCSVLRKAVSAQRKKYS